MANKSKVSRTYKPSIESTPRPKPERVVSGYTKLRLLIDVIYRINGEVTKTPYVWHRSNSVQSVDDRDAPALLAKKRKGSCCGSDGGKIFEVVT
jgi:hypothetical protein